MKVLFYKDGKLQQETDPIEVRFFNRFDDSMFTEPH